MSLSRINAIYQYFFFFGIFLVSRNLIVFLPLYPLCCFCSLLFSSLLCFYLKVYYFLCYSVSFVRYSLLSVLCPRELCHTEPFRCFILCPPWLLFFTSAGAHETRQPWGANIIETLAMGRSSASSRSPQRSFTPCFALASVLFRAPR